jgi:glycosyltransferase involved in cell wall biosynthesis
VTQVRRVIQQSFYNNPDGYPPIVNGIRLLSRHGFQVRLLCREDGKTWNVAYPTDAQIIRLDTRGYGTWQEYLQFVYRVLRQADPNSGVFIGHDMHGLLPARLLAWRYHRPLIYHCHDFVDCPRNLGWGGKVVKVFEQLFGRTANVVIVPDKDRAGVVERELHLRRPILVVANAPLSGEWPKSLVLQQSLADQGKNFERILFRQGRIGAGHGLEMTVRSMPLWKDPNWGFVIMGPADPVYATWLRQLAKELHVAERLVILSPVRYDDVASFTAGANVGHALYDPIHINNVHITTASNKIMEYMAAGLPLLVSDQPTLRAFVEKHQCGLAANETSPESIAAAVNTLLGDLPSAEAMGKAARVAFEQEFCYERQFAPVLVALESLVKNIDHP